MKKILSMAAIALLTITASCSSDDSNETVNPDASSAFLKKAIYTDEEGFTDTTEYTYDGNKLSKITYSEGMEETFTYTNGLLTEKLTYETETNELVRKTTYTYNSANKLVEFKEVFLGESNPSTGRSTFTYNDDNTVVTIQEYYTFGSGEETNQGTYTKSLANGNIISHNFVDQLGATHIVKSFTYDDKNDPLKNVLGYDVMILTNSRYGSGVNNVLTESTQNGLLYSTVYQYNANNYPTLATYTEEGVTSTTQYFYE